MVRPHHTHSSATPRRQNGNGPGIDHGQQNIAGTYWSVIKTKHVVLLEASRVQIWREGTAQWRQGIVWGTEEGGAAGKEGSSLTSSFQSVCFTRRTATLNTGTTSASFFEPASSAEIICSSELFVLPDASTAPLLVLVPPPEDGVPEADAFLRAPAWWSLVAAGTAVPPLTLPLAPMLPAASPSSAVVGGGGGGGVVVVALWRWNGVGNAHDFGWWRGMEGHTCIFQGSRGQTLRHRPAGWCHKAVAGVLLKPHRSNFNGPWSTAYRSYY